jgi:hypothetical protein
MERIPLISSNIISVGYDKERKILEIEFTAGAIYQYFNVPQNIYKALLNADSSAKYFDQNIKKNGYRYRRISTEQFSEVEFISYLIQLMNANSDFSNIEIDTLYRDSEDRLLKPDIVCKYKNKKLLIETKIVAPLTPGRISNYIDQIKSYTKIDKNSEVVLVIPSKLQQKYHELFQKENIIIWDINKLANLFYNQLNSIIDSKLYYLLYNESKVRKEKSQVEKFVDDLKKIKMGINNWVEYQKLCANVFEYLFTPPLAKPLYELSDFSKVNRRDIIIPNYSDNGFWKFLREKYSADFIVIDAKNLTKSIQKREVLQISNYLKSFGTGLFGIITSRNTPKNNAILTQREHWIAYNKLIIFLDDQDLIQMLIMKDKSESPEDVIRQKVEDFRLSL